MASGVVRTVIARSQAVDARALRRRFRAGVIVELLRGGWRPPALTDEQTDRLLDDMRRTGRHQTIGLTANELDVLERIARGRTYAEIASETARSFETIKKTEERIRGKLGARNAAHAVGLAMSQDLIGPVE